jgi:3-hydroxymyristoyl/3-hydroxydecanoyl-(acyl carrier protein) dehydratase
MPPSSPSATLGEALLVSGTDLFALGHYPGAPIYPGVLLLDQLLVLAERLATRTAGHPMRVRTMARVQYLDAILPGDVVNLEATVRTSGPDGLSLAATASVRGKPCARANFACGACKLATRQSPLFAAQAPAVYPAGLAIESLGQAGIALFFLGQAGGAPREVVLGAMTGIELIHDVPFDSVLTLDARIDRLLPNAVVFGGEVRIGPTPVIRVGSLVAMIDPRHAPT